MYAELFFEKLNKEDHSCSVLLIEYVNYTDLKQPIGIRIKELMKRTNLDKKIDQLAQVLQFFFSSVV